MKFSVQLQKIMQHFGLTTTEMADKINVPKATISHLISERNKPSLEFITKVHTTFPTLNLEWLIYGKEPFLTHLIQTENNSNHHTPTLNFEEDSSENQEPPIDKKEEEHFETNLFTNDTIEQTAHENISEKMINNAENVLSSQLKKIESIVIFYTDGSFKQYTP